jgi:aspartate/methionine/tyrosine aminotransferase
VFARRASWDLTPNPLAERVTARRAAGLPVVDLGDANATRAGLREPGAALVKALAIVARDPETARYEPDPRGDPGARAAIAAHQTACGAALRPEHVLLTAGTSEGYAHLFRLLADPGDVVHLPTPGYPLFKHLAELEGVSSARYPLRPPSPRGAGGRWRIDLDALAAGLGPRSRAVVLIHPHNPTGSWVDPEDLAEIRALARERGMAIVSDEVFSDTCAAPQDSVLVGAEAGPLHFVLGGASKLLALPQLKIAWIAVAGPTAARDEAVGRLEFIADAYLSVSPILARALPFLLAHRESIRDEIHARVAANRTALAAALAGGAASLLSAEAGWSAIVRVPGMHDEEKLVLALLERTGVLVQPGFLFELDPLDPEGRPCAHLVVSVLAEPEPLAAGAAALAGFLS